MVFEKVRDIIANQLELEADVIKPESTILDELGADSLDVVDLVMTIEDEFNIEVPDEEMENIRTVKDVVKFIQTGYA